MDNLDLITQAIDNKTIPQQAVSGRPLSESVLPRETMLWLWQMMGSMYGHKWVSSFGAEADPDRVWASCLKGISNEQIKHGLNRCALECMDWPPSAPEFRALCIDWCEGQETAWEHKRIESADNEQATQPARLENKTEKELQREKNKQRMKEMREKIGI